MSNHEDKKKHEDHEFDGKTFLYIRTHPNDDGTEPLPAGLPFWISPDITVIQPGNVRGDEAVANETNQVEVVVTNAGGIDAVDAYVEAFVADPSTAFAPATATLIGGTFTTIPGYNTSTVTFNWIPLPADAGHRCLLARVCLTIPLDCYTDGSIFDVVGDRHVAQRNIHVVELAEKSLSFGFKIVNPLKEKGDFLVRAMEVRANREADLIRMALGCRLAQFAEVPLREVTLTIGETIVPREVSAEKGKPISQPLGVLPKAMTLKRSKSGRVEMKPGEIRYAVLTVTRNPDVRPGDISVVQVEQIDVRTKKVVGGLWLIVKN